VLVLEGNLPNVIFFSWCNVFVGNLLVFVLQGKLACARLPVQFNVVVCNPVVLVLLEGILTHAMFPSLCNVVVINDLVLVLKIKLTHPSWFNVVDNVLVLVLEGKLASAGFS